METIEKINQMITDGVITREQASKYFPELKETESENISKALIKLVKKAGEGYENVTEGVSIQKAISWLEKQGEKMSDPRYIILDKLIEADDIYQASVNDAMVEEARHRAIEALSKLEISKLLGLEKQGEQKSEEVDNLHNYLYGEQKSSWSEEDDDDAWLNDIISKAECNLQLNKDEIDWLKSLRNRVLPQPKQEWSIEDEAIEDAETWLDILCDYLKDSSSGYIPTVKNVISKLKSLRPQNSWKPSVEQMDALNLAIGEANSVDTAAGDEAAGILTSLFEQLKKLMKE